MPGRLIHGEPLLFVVDEPFVLVVKVLAGASVDAIVVRTLGALVDEPVDVLVVGFVGIYVVNGSIDDAGVKINVRFWQFTCLR
jgi:hypothetical protein